MNSQANQNQTQSVKVVKERKQKKNVKINEPTSETIIEISPPQSETPSVEIETVKLVEPIEVVETEEERELRLEEEAMAEQMAKMARRKAELKAKKDMTPLREAEIKSMEKEKEIAINNLSHLEANIEIKKRELDAAIERYNKARELIDGFNGRMEAIDRGEMDSELLKKIGDRSEIVAKKEMVNVSKKIEVVEERGRGREREREVRAKSPARERSKSPNRGENRQLLKLENILQQPTRFMYKVFSQNNKEFYATTKRGDKIIYELEDRNIEVKKLSMWIDALEKHFNDGVNKRKISVCDKNKESVYYFHQKSMEWRRLSNDWNEDTLVLNPR
jgi:hypothetical protein